MGIDVEMYVQSDGEPSDIWLPSGWTLHEARELDREAGATHSIGTHCRYYGMHYARGPWPEICGVLMSLFASTNVKRVWYFGDRFNFNDGVPPITREEVLQISQYYMLHGERPYRDKTYTAHLKR